LGEAIVAMQMPEKSHQLRVSTLSMFILLLFNQAQAQAQGLTVEQIMSALAIDEPSCRKNLQSLSTPKFRILQKATAETEQQNEFDPD
jgi:hypothetical protein